jgi:hypothetical protein
VRHQQRLSVYGTKRTKTELGEDPLFAPLRTLAPDASGQIATGGRVNSRWLQAQDLDLFPAFSLVMYPCSV